jgi:hypothetical protein
VDESAARAGGVWEGAKERIASAVGMGGRKADKAAGAARDVGEGAAGAGKDFAGQLQDAVAGAATKARGKHASGGEL